MGEIMLQQSDVVLTESGRVQGFTSQSVSADVPVDCFLGIPYAAAPVQELRWKAPQAPKQWNDIRQCFNFAADSPQTVNPSYRAPHQSEDCLFLNVWSPAVNSSQKLPVMVWIYGGGFVAGSGSDPVSDGALMASKGVVVVSFNYRAGVFGFLAHPALSAESECNVSGNYGLLDQIAALKWVQKNITQFGGDPNRVTLFGFSAGSASIALLLACSHAKGLFHQSILQSPGSARPLATLPEAEALSLKELGSDLAHLRSLDSQQILKLTGLFNPKIRGLTTPRILRPILDGYLLTQNERDVLKSHQQAMLPMIVGSNLDEGSLLTKDWTIKSINDYVGLVNVNFKDFASEAFQLYSAKNESEVTGAVAQLFGDTQFNYGTRLLAQSNSNRVEKTWRYLFAKRRPSQADGPHHGQEVAHVFGNLSAKMTAVENDYDQQDKYISDTMLKYWVQFAYTGNPNQASLPGWPKYEIGLDNMIVFGNEISYQMGYRQKNLDFIDRYFD